MNAAERGQKPTDIISTVEKTSVAEQWGHGLP